MDQYYKYLLCPERYGLCTTTPTPHHIKELSTPPPPKKKNKTSLWKNIMGKEVYSFKTLLLY